MLRNKEPELAEKIDTHSGILTSVFTASISFLAPGTLLLSSGTLLLSLAPGTNGTAE